MTALAASDIRLVLKYMTAANTYYWVSLRILDHDFFSPKDNDGSPVVFVAVSAIAS